MIPRLVTALLVCSLTILAHRPSAGQMPETILRLKPKTTLRLETPSMGRIQGQFVRATPDTLFLSRETGEVGVPFHEVGIVSQRGRATVIGAVVGGVIGGLGLGLVASALDSISDESSGNGSTGGAVAAGAVGGALVGGLIGTAIPTWRHRYP